jgi:hypothetical protein
MQRPQAKFLPLSALDGASSAYLQRPVVAAAAAAAALKNNGGDDEDEEDHGLPPLPLPAALEQRMFPHQREGVQWLYNLHHRELGGILGDDMGLGKTFQVCCLLAGLLRGELAQRVLIVCPVSVLSSWQRELCQHLVPHVKQRVTLELVTSDVAKKRRQTVLWDVFNGSRSSTSPFVGKVVVTSYQLLSGMVEDFAGRGTWDYVILDEGHCIKNPATKMYKAMQALRARHRLILTGTFIQNKLEELWALVNWATDGTLLGTKADFKRAFIDPIMEGQDPLATPDDRAASRQATALMQKLTGRVILQRKKCEHQAVLNLTEKVEVVVWVPLATSQRGLYERYLADRHTQQSLQRAEEKRIFPVEVPPYLAPYLSPHRSPI